MLTNMNGMIVLMKLVNSSTGLKSYVTRSNKGQKDEIYTTYDVIQAELNYYTDKFKDKTVPCNCHDPFGSNYIAIIV